VKDSPRFLPARVALGRTFRLVAAALLLGLAGALQAADAVQHIVLLNIDEEAPSAAVGQLLDALDALPSQIPGFKGSQWGVNNSPEGLNQGFTHGFYMTFESAEALEKYIPHPTHQAVVKLLEPVSKGVFVFDFPVPQTPAPAEAGRVHHLVFFKFKAGAPKDAIDKVNAAFAALPKRIPGLLQYQAGEAMGGKALTKGFTHGYVLTFVNDRARNDYLIHPAHKEFGSLLGPILDGVLVFDFTVVPSSRSLFITDGLEPYAVYQRKENGCADLKFSGVCAKDGAVEARLVAGRRTVAGFDWKPVGKAEKGVFQAVIKDVPTGGEYTVEVRRRDALGNVGDHTEVANILVGDLWILAGQSNMEGVGDLMDVEEPTPQVHCYTMAHRWELAVEPLHWLVDSPDPVHSGGALNDMDEEGRRAVRARVRAQRTKGAGLGLPFAKELTERTGVPIGLIASGHGGTSMEQWDPAKRDLGGDSLYGSMLKQVKNAGGKVKGALWYQGESDANSAAAPLFMERFKNLVAAFRKDFGSPDMPFYYVQIGAFVVQNPPDAWNRIQELQRLAEKEIPGTAMISVIDLPLDDLIHVGTCGLKRAGKRLAKIADRELFRKKEILRGPRLAGIEPSADGRIIRVKYSEVNGRLLPAQKVEGFSLRKADGSELKLIYNVSVDPKAPDTVVLKLQNPAPADALIQYGAGCDPACNLVDAEDMAAPVFGPLPLKK